jgi:hypothetical protein
MESHEEKLRRLYDAGELSRLSGAIGKALDHDGFVEALLLQDSVGDWQLALELGQYLALIYPNLLVGQVIVARASRHLGAHSEAGMALRKCQELVRRGAASAMDLDVLVPIIEAEERALLDDTPR